jgi:DNA-binding transcriptional ArsR family regulator
MAMSSETELLKEISHKLSQLIVLTKLSNAKIIAETKEAIKKDPASVAILNLADGSLTSSQINQRVQEKTKLSERTVQGRIADLIEKGALNSIRRGQELYYENSGLYD